MDSDQAVTPDLESLCERLKNQANAVDTWVKPAAGDLYREAASALYSLQARITDLEGERDEAREGESRWLVRVHDIRRASGVGVKPMLAELPDAIAAKIKAAEEDAASWKANAAEEFLARQAAEAQVREAVEVLEWIDDHAPATQEHSLAHEMASLAASLLQRLKSPSLEGDFSSRTSPSVAVASATCADGQQKTPQNLTMDGGGEPRDDRR